MTLLSALPPNSYDHTFRNLPDTGDDARTRRDAYRGYNGYVLERNNRRILFGGDTALSDSFAELRASSPIDLAIMPTGAYNPWIHSHRTPEQAVHMANEAGAHFIMPATMPAPAIIRSSCSTRFLNLDSIRFGRPRYAPYYATLGAQRALRGRPVTVLVSDGGHGA